MLKTEESLIAIKKHILKVFGNNSILTLLYSKLYMSSLKHSNIFQKVYETAIIPFSKFLNEKYWKKLKQNSIFSCATCTFLVFSFSQWNIKPMNGFLVCNKTWNSWAYNTTFKYNTLKTWFYFIYYKNKLCLG